MKKATALILAIFILIALPLSVSAESTTELSTFNSDYSLMRTETISSTKLQGTSSSVIGQVNAKYFTDLKVALTIYEDGKQIHSSSKTGYGVTLAYEIPINYRTGCTYRVVAKFTADKETLSDEIILYR